MPHFYWQDQIRYEENGRLLWFGEDATEDFWLHYWEQQVGDPKYYQKACELELRTSIEGRIFLARLSKDGVHLEAGCGTGFWVKALHHAGYNIKGIEYSPELVNVVRENQPDLPIEFGNILSIPYPDNSFDSYISLGGLEHNYEGPELFLKEAYRVLKPGGKVIVSVPFFGFIRRLNSRLGKYSKTKPDLPFFQFGFTKQQFVDFLHNADFKVESTYYIGIDRLLTEEIKPYRWLIYQKGGHYLRKLITKVFSSLDGHMIILVGSKSR